MKQSIEMMRKRHAYYTKLIVEHNIQTAREFCEKLGEMFEMFGVDIGYSDSAGFISITCEDYDYEDYTILDGESGGLATICNVVKWKPLFCHEEVDIFKVKEWEQPKLNPKLSCREEFKNRNQNLTKEE